MAATQQQIQYAVKTFLSGTSAENIFRLVWDNYDNRPLLVQSARVVEKLVELVVHNQPAGEGKWALGALCCLVEVGQVAQDAIARAHNGDIFTWLAGPEDHGISNNKTSLITNLTNNHVTNTRLLQAARAGGESRVKVEKAAARGGNASFVELVRDSICNGDSATAALAMDEFFTTQRDKDAAVPLPSGSIPALVNMMNLIANSTDTKLSMAQDKAVVLLLKHIHVEEARVALTQSSLGVREHLSVLTSETSNVRSKLLAVIRLSAQLNAKESNALAIVLEEGVLALVSTLVSTQSQTQNQILVKPLLEYTASALIGLIEASPNVRKSILERGDIDSLYQLCQSGVSSHKTAALDALRGFLREESLAVDIARRYGLPCLIQILHHDKQQKKQQQTPVIKIISSVLASDDDLSTLYLAPNSERTIALLFSLLDEDKSPATVAYLSTLTAKLGGLIPFLIASLEFLAARLGNDVDDKDTLLATLKTLEPLSQSPANKHFFHQEEDVAQLTKLLQASSNAEVKARTMRILANIAWKSPFISELIVKSDVLHELFAMMKSTDVKDQTVALMALRNLTNNDSNRRRIGSPDVISKLIQLSSSSKAAKQREVAVAVLGNLAHLAANQQSIRLSGGPAAVLAFIPHTKTPQQLETATAALSMIFDTTKDIKEKNKYAAIIQKAAQLHQSNQVPWATRVLVRLR